MKQFIRCLKLCALTLCVFLFINQKVYAVTIRYTLTAVFYDNEEALSKFMNEGLEYEFKNINLSDSIVGFSEKIPNPLKSRGMNTIHLPNTTKIVTKLIPVDSRKLKTLPPTEYAKLQGLLKICMAGIILFDYSDPKLGIFQEFWVSRDCKTFLEHDFTFNHVFKLMASVKWGNFVGVYTYNASTLTQVQWEKQYSNLEQYMGSLERFFGVDNRWDTRCQTEKVESAFKTIADSGSGVLGSAPELIRNEPLVKEYLRTKGVVLESTPPTTILSVPTRHVSPSVQLAENKKLKKRETIVPMLKTSPYPGKLRQIEEEISPQILKDEIRSLETQIQRNIIEIENLIKIVQYDATALFKDDVPIKTDVLDNKKLNKHIKELKEKLRKQEAAIQELETHKRLPWYKRKWLGLI